MHPKINIAVAVVAVLFILALSLPETYELMLVDKFTGISGDRAVTANLSNPKSLVNGDIIMRNGQSIIKQRSGFTKMGTTLEAGPIAGLARFSSAEDNNEILTFSGNSLYRYNNLLGDWEEVTAQNPLAAICTVTNGMDTVRGVNTAWWPLSKYRPQFIRILDGGANHLIKAILTNNILILDTAWAGATNNAAACTLGLTYGIGSTGIVRNETAPKRSSMFMNRLITVDGTQRFQYVGSEIAAGSFPKITSIAENASFPWQGKMKISMSGDIIDGLQVGDYVMFNNENIPGVSMRNTMVKVFGISGQNYHCYADTIIAEWLNADADEEYEVQRYPLGDTIYSPFHIAKVAHVWIDSIADEYSPGGKYLFKYWITTDVDDAPTGWGVDSINWGTYKAANAREPYYPVTLDTLNDSIKFVVYDYGVPQQHAFDDGDSICIWRIDSTSAVIPADTLLHGSWPYGLQCLLNNRMYYSSEDSSEVWYTAEYTYSGVDGSFYVNRDDGDQNTCLVPLGRNLLIGKKRNLYMGIISSYDNAPDEVVKIESPTGIPSQEAVQEYGGVIYFISPPYGLFAYNGVNVVNISGPAQFYFADSVAANTEPDMRLIVATDKTIGTPGIYISYTNVGGTENDRTLRLDLTTGNWSKYTNFGASCFSILRGGAGYGDSLLFGTPVDGDSYILKFPSGTKDTAEYVDLEYETGFTNFGTSLVLKRWLEYVPIYTSAAAGSLFVTWYVDWSGTATLVDSFESSAGWQAPRRGLDGVQGKSVGFKIKSREGTNVEIGSLELYYQDGGGTDD